MEEICGDTLKSFCLAVNDLERFIHGKLDCNLSESEVNSKFEEAKAVEVAIESLQASGLKESFYIAAKKESSQGEPKDLMGIADRILAKFLSPSVDSKLALSAVKKYISLFGDDRFATACLGLVKTREVFVKASSVASTQTSPAAVSCALVCESWQQSLRFGSEESVKEVIDKTLQQDPYVILEISSLNDIAHLNPIRTLMYNHISAKLKTENPKNLCFWPIVIKHPKFFQGLLQNDPSFFDCVEDNLISSCMNYALVNSSWDMIDETSGFTVDQIVTIVYTLITSDTTFHKIKDFINHQKSGGHKEFWTIVEEEYLKKLALARTESQAPARTESQAPGS